MGELLGRWDREGKISFPVLANGFGKFFSLLLFLVNFEVFWLRGLTSFGKVGRENAFIFQMRK